MKTKILGLALLTLLANAANAVEGGKEGHGAGGILHKDKVYLLDFVENGLSAKVYFKDPKDFSQSLADHLSDVVDVEQLDYTLVAAKLREMYKKSPGLAYFFLRGIELHSWSLAGFPEDNPDRDTKLTDVPDENSFIDLKSDPKVQIAYRDDDDKSVAISAKAWALMDMPQKVGVLFHEVACSYMNPDSDSNDWVVPTKRDCKRMTALLFSKKFFAGIVDQSKVLGNSGLTSLFMDAVATNRAHDKIYKKIVPFSSEYLQLSVNLGEVPKLENHKYFSRSGIATGKDRAELMANIQKVLDSNNGMFLSMNLWSKDSIPLGDSCYVKRYEWKANRYDRNTGAFTPERYNQIQVECTEYKSGEYRSTQISEDLSIKAAGENISFAASGNERNLCGQRGCTSDGSLVGVLRDRYAALVSGQDEYFKSEIAKFLGQTVPAAIDKTIADAKRDYDAVAQDIIFFKDLF